MAGRWGLTQEGLGLTPGSGGPKTGLPGPCSPNTVWFAWVWMMQQAGALKGSESLLGLGALQEILNLQQVLKIHQAKPCYPATIT